MRVPEQPAQPVLSIRAKTSVSNLPQELGKAYGMIIEDLNVEMGFMVPKPFPDKGPIKAGEIPAGKHF